MAPKATGSVKSKAHKLSSSASAESGAVAVFTVRHMPAFSSGFFQLGRRAALEANEEPRREEHPMAAVIMAATALESFVNEQIEFPGTHDASMRTIGKELHDSRGLSIEAKWTILVRLLCGKTFDRGKEPYQSFSLLIDLRNVLVHRASRFRLVDEFPNARMTSLAQNFTFSTASVEGERMTWDKQVLNPACARWSVNTPAAMISEHWRLTGAVQPKERVRVQWEMIP